MHNNHQRFRGNCVVKTLKSSAINGCKLRSHLLSRPVNAMCLKGVKMCFTPELELICTYGQTNSICFLGYDNNTDDGNRFNNVNPSKKV